MEVKENRPDACAASGTANSIYKDFSTDAPDIQEELTGPVLPDECAADIVSFCSEQTIAYDDLLEYATLFYLQDKDPEDPPFRDTLKFELLTLTNRCIDAYNFGKRDPNAAPGAKLKDAYPDKKEGAERYPHLFDMTIHGNPILSGGSCKIEGSIIVLFMNLAFLIGFVAAKKRKDRNR